jgi:hypothetical protein
LPEATDFVAPIDPWPLLAFVDAVRTLQDASISPVKVEYLYRDVAQPATMAPNDKAVERFLASLAAELRKIERA